MSYSEKRFLSGLLNRLFSSKKDIQASVKNDRVQKTLQARQLSLEPLEERQLLAVTAADYLAIQNSFESLQLDDYSSVNLIEIDNASLTSTSLKNAISQAGTTQQNDVIIVRTTAENNTIDLNGEILNINIDAQSFGNISILGYGDSMLHLTNSGLTILSVENGEVGLGKISFDSLDNGVASKKSLLFEGKNAVVATQQVLFSSCYSVDSKLSADSSSKDQVADGYYSAEFQLEGSRWVYVTGLSEFEAQDIENNINAQTHEYSVGSFYDAEKTGVGDTQHCWAATSANMLHYTNWDYFLRGNEDDTFDVFRNNFDDKASNSYYGNDWFITDNYDPQNVAGWAQVIGEGGGYYASYNLNINDYTSYIDTKEYYTDYNESPIAEVGRLMGNGDGIGISLGWFEESEGESEGEVIYTRNGGHAITMWGFVYDDEKEVDATDYYISVIVTDSDDNYGEGREAQDRLQTYAVTWHEEVGGYQFDSYGRGATYSGIIDGFCSVEQKPAELSGNDLQFETPSNWTAPVVITETEDSHNGRTRVTAGIPLYMSLNWLQTSARGNYTVTVSDNGNVIETIPITGQSGSNEYQLNLGMPDGGFHHYVVTLDSEDVMKEGDENNNVYELTIEIVEVNTHEDIEDPNDGFWSVREVISLINDESIIGNVVQFSDEVTAQTIQLNSPLTITAAMTIDATKNWYKAAPGVTISGEGLYNIFQIQGTLVEDVVIKGLALQNGFGDIGGAIFHDANNKLLLENCTISNSTAEYGGAIYNQRGTLEIVSYNEETENEENAENVPLKESIIRNNSAIKDGGAIYMLVGSLITNGVTFTENSAVNGGAIHAVSNSNTLNVVPITLQKTTLTNNWAMESGGAVRAWNCIINDSLIENNEANSGAGIVSWNNLILNNSSVISNGSYDNNLFSCKYGGGIYASGNITLGEGTIISDNQAHYGGGIFLFKRDNQDANDPSDLIFTASSHSRIENNLAYSGGGVYVNTGGNVVIDSGNIVNNTAQLNGGGIFNYTGTVRIINDQTISGNNALKGSGGGIYNDGTLEISYHGKVNDNIAGLSGGGIFNGSLLTIERGSISGNSAFDGGGIYNIGTMSVSNSILSANNAQSRGGGFFNQASIYNVSVVDTTIAGNKSGAKGGGVYNAGKINVNNSIIAKNYIQADTAITKSDLYTLKGNNAVSNVDYSLISDPTDTEKALVGQNNIVGSQFEAIDPMFILLDIEVPYSQWNLQLQFGKSPAINAGPIQDENISVDYNGTVRKTGLANDMGAFEMYEASSLVVTTLDDVVDETDGLISLREAVEYLKANQQLVERTITFDENLAGGTIYLTEGSLWINVSMTIDASGLYNSQTLMSGITINGMGKDRVFYIAKDIENTEKKVVVFNSLTITGGYIDADNQGGGIYSEGGSGIYNRSDLSLINCVVTGNMTTFYGGAIFNQETGTLTVVNSTIAGNYATIGGGIYNKGIATIENSIVAKNRSTDASDIWTEDKENVHSFVDYSLIGSASYNTGKGIEPIIIESEEDEETEQDPEQEPELTYIAGTSAKPLDPLFITYSIYSIKDWNYDIAQNWNLRIGNDSPAYNAGSNDLAVDQNGNPLQWDIDNNDRIYDEIVDFGAYEATPDVPGIVVTTLVDIVNEYDGGISLREAIQYAGTNDFGTQITFASGLAGQTLFLNGTVILLDKSISIDASNLIQGEISGVTIDAQGLSQIFNIAKGTEESPVQITISGLQLQNGFSEENGGAIHNAGILSLIDSQLNDNVAISGGAVYNVNSLEIKNTKFANNLAQYIVVEELDEEENPIIIDVFGGEGGAIYNNGQLNISASSFEGNIASEGGAISNQASAILIADSLVASENIASEFVYNIVKDSEENIISFDSYGGEGGAISNLCGENDDSELILANAYLTNSVFFGNKAATNGAAFLNYGNATFVNCTIAGNSAEFGGGIYNDSNSVILNNSIVANNFSTDNADIWTSNEIETTTVSHNSLIGNTQTTESKLNKVVDLDQSSDSLFDVDPEFAVSPLFDENGVLLNAESLDLTIGIYSPAFNAGSNALAIDVANESLLKDLTNQTRIVAGTVDLGAYEWQIIVTTAQDVVDPDDGLLSLREAIAIAQDNDVITFDESLFRSVISLNNKELLVSKAITIDADNLWDYEYNQPGLTIDAHQRSRIFNVNGTTENDKGFKINRLTMINGTTNYKGGAIINSYKTELDNCIISSSSTFYGGAIYNTGTILAYNTIFSNNSATYGGAVYTASTGKSSLANITFENNQATYGGASYNKGETSIELSSVLNNSAKYGGAVYNQAGSVTFVETNIKENSAIWKGGAVYNNKGTSFFVEESSFVNNTTYYGAAIYNLGTSDIKDSSFDSNKGTLGGSIYNATGGSLTIQELDFTNNQAANYGGAICNNGITFNVQDCFFGQNDARRGGAIYNYANELNLSNVIFVSNTADKGASIYNNGTVNAKESVFQNGSSLYGGAIYNTKSLNIVDTDFVYNSASQNGGAVYSTSNKISTVYASKFAGNQAISGGAIYLSAGSMKIYNSIISGNKASKNGGGIFNNGSLSVTNSTIAGNTAFYYGGGIYNSKTLEVNNSILAKNSTTIRRAYDIFTKSNTAANSFINFSLIENAKASAIGKEIIGTDNLLNVDPLFEQYEAYDFNDWSSDIGDDWDFSLKSDSEAIDRGSNELAIDAVGDLLETDYLGNDRIVNDIVDMGAIEYFSTEDDIDN